MNIDVTTNENVMTINKHIDLVAEKRQFKNEKNENVEYVDYYIKLCGSEFKVRGFDKKFFIHNLTSDALDKIFNLKVGDKTTLASYELM